MRKYQPMDTEEPLENSSSQKSGFSKNKESKEFLRSLKLDTNDDTKYSVFLAD